MKLYELLLEIGGTKAPVNWQQTNNSYTGTFNYNDRLYRIDVRNIMLEPSDFKYLQIPDHSHLIIYNIGFGAWDEASNKMSLNLTNQHSAIKIFSIVQNAVIQLFVDKHIIPDILALSVSKHESNNTSQEFTARLQLYNIMAKKLADKENFEYVYPNLDGPNSSSVLLSRTAIPVQVLTDFSKLLYTSGQTLK